MFVKKDGLALQTIIVLSLASAKKTSAIAVEKNDLVLQAAIGLSKVSAGDTRNRR